MTSFIVTVPFRAEQYYLVEAKSAAEAKRKVNDDHEDDAVEALDFRVTKRFLACSAEPDTYAQPTQTDDRCSGCGRHSCNGECMHGD